MSATRPHDPVTKVSVTLSSECQELSNCPAGIHGTNRWRRFRIFPKRVAEQAKQSKRQPNDRVNDRVNDTLLTGSRHKIGR